MKIKQNKKTYLKLLASFLSLIFFVVNHVYAAEDLSRITDNGGIVYFADDYESGYQYMGVSNPHPGGGFYQMMGGNVLKPEGIYTGDGTVNGCVQDTNNYHYTINSNDAEAKNFILGSQKSLKTPYLGVCPGEAFLRDTTIIKTPLLSEYYVRWYQKWTGSFQSSVQQKFSKFYYGSDPNSAITGHLSMRPNNSSGTTPGATSGLFEEYFINIDNHFAKSGCTPPNNSLIWLTPTSFSCYAGQNKGWDDSTETNELINLELNRWYEIEIHSKLNSDINTSDAEHDLWIDGVLKLQVRNFKFVNDVITTPGTNNFEFQHVYYNRSNQDQTTYMDNIVIANRHIGPVNTPLVTYSVSNFTTLFSNWLHTGNGNVSDFDFNNIVNTKDLGILMSKWQ